MALSTARAVETNGCWRSVDLNTVETSPLAALFDKTVATLRNPDAGFDPLRLAFAPGVFNFTATALDFARTDHGALMLRAKLIDATDHVQAWLVDDSAFAAHAKLTGQDGRIAFTSNENPEHIYFTMGDSSHHTLLTKLHAQATESGYSPEIEIAITAVEAHFVFSAYHELAHSILRQLHPEWLIESTPPAPRPVSPAKSSKKTTKERGEWGELVEAAVAGAVTQLRYKQAHGFCIAGTFHDGRTRIWTQESLNDFMGTFRAGVPFFVPTINVRNAIIISSHSAGDFSSFAKVPIEGPVGRNPEPSSTGDSLCRRLGEGLEVLRIEDETGGEEEKEEEEAEEEAEAAKGSARPTLVLEDGEKLMFVCAVGNDMAGNDMA
ncbi:hypothetical protein MNV49_007394 [Pseudohyphozyma bogoriensis]|nr:hypothetical protein MNV49_007394 [Pseudohyphozyma bogoriensis]